MPQQIKFDSKPAVIPVVHPSGELHHIAVPDPDIPLREFHDALGASGYHFPQPRREDALEFSPEFRDAAKKAASMMQTGELLRKTTHNITGDSGEAGFTVDRNGVPSPVSMSRDARFERGGMKQKLSDTDIGAFHTHDAFHQADPSEGDKQAARNSGKVIWVASRDGLYAVDKDGKSQLLFNRADWYNDKPKSK